MGHKTQQEILRKNAIDLLVGTPGRILDYLRNGYLKLNNVEILIIDEADRMLDMGFIPDVRKIVTSTPRPGKRQTMFFSATFDESILRLVNNWLKDPERIEIESENVVTDLIDQKFVTISRDEKLAYLLWLINHENIERMLVFGNRKDKNNSLYRALKDYGIKCDLLTGDVPQKKRMQILERFRSGKSKIIIATDVAARGIHVDNVSHVVNYDLPERAEDYVHRVGRTGRAGKSGKSISFVCEYGAYTLQDIEKLINTEVKCLHLEENQVHLPPKPKGINNSHNKNSKKTSNNRQRGNFKPHSKNYKNN